MNRNGCGMAEYARRLVALLTGLSLIVALAGCASDSMEGYAFTYRGDLQVGQTTREEVIASYGPPTSSEMRGNLEVMTYLYQSNDDLGPENNLDALSILPMVGLAVFVIQSGGNVGGEEPSDDGREFRHLSVVVDRKNNRCSRPARRFRFWSSRWRRILTTIGL